MPNFAPFDPAKIRGGVGEISESVFRVRPRTQPLIYFRLGTTGLSRRSEVGFGKKVTSDP